MYRLECPPSLTISNVDLPIVRLLLESNLVSSLFQCKKNHQANKSLARFNCKKSFTVNYVKLFAHN